MTDYLKFDKRKTAGSRTRMTAAEFRKEYVKEDVIQKHCEELLKIHNIKYVHVPDMLWKFFKIRGLPVKMPESLRISMLKLLSSMFKGLPDLLIFLPGPCDYNFVWFVELKSKKGTTTQGQKNFGKKLNLSVIRSYEVFEKELYRFIGYVKAKNAL